MNATGLTGYAGRGINEAFQTAMTDALNTDTSGGLSSEGVGGGESYASYDSGGLGGGGDVGSLSTASFGGDLGGIGVGGGGGGGANDFSDYETKKDFLGSKKKSRYRRPNSLMAMLGDDNAA
jgi:hypothetical protein